MGIDQLKVILLILVSACLASCVALSSQNITKEFQRPSGCEEFLDALDAKVIDAGVLDAFSFRVPGFPYLPQIGSFHRSREHCGMRQRGHHAIELIDQVHFDDPYLLGRNSVFR